MQDLVYRSSLFLIFQNCRQANISKKSPHIHIHKIFLNYALQTVKPFILNVSNILLDIKSQDFWCSMKLKNISS